MKGRQRYDAKMLLAVVGAALVASTLSGSLIAEFAVGQADVRTYHGEPRSALSRHRLRTEPGDPVAAYDAVPRTTWAAPFLSTPDDRHYVDDHRLEDDLARLEAQWKAEDRARDKEDRAREAELRASLETVTTQPSTWSDDQAGGSARPANTPLVDPTSEQSANDTPS
ncbi:hypothetical protein HRV97_13330 [Sphingomonas sp. HHU CXW]|uniref:Uncharacterized protein n=1 Tax=Sphingomonas hominis TaxID=2741495 RepID=A0ABX2JHX6_9SPHN|nr:hypothetical protein [Sphingomonas hominis]NTS66141.1 hypothetical protein [Sphingomonas hominis]